MLQSAITEQQAKPQRSIEAIKEILAKAKEKKTEKDALKTKDEILDLEAELKMLSDQENASLMQTKQYKEKLEDNQETLAELKMNMDALVEAGENVQDLTTDIEKMIADINALIQKCATDQSALLAEKLAKQERLRQLRGVLARVDTEKDQKYGGATDPGNERETYSDTQEDGFTSALSRTARYLAACRNEIQEMHAECKKLPLKMTAYAHEKNIRTFIVMDLAARVKVFQAEPEYHGINDSEDKVLYAIGSVMRLASKMCDLFYIEALSNRTRPTDFTTWREYAIDSSKQLKNYLSPAVLRSEKPKFGVVSPAPAPTIIDVVGEVLTEVARPKRREPEPEPEQKESTDKILKGIVDSSGVIKHTAGKRVAIIAGAADKNSPLRTYLQEVFKFKKLIWHDTRKSEHLITSMKVGGIDLIIAIPAWHKGYRLYTGFASKMNIRSLILLDHLNNKPLICQQVCKFFGTEIDVSGM